MVKIVLAALFLAVPAGAADESAWTVIRTPHFQLHQEHPGSRSCVADMEKVFNVLRREIRFLAEWSDRTRVNVYLYRDKESYLAGKFSPPEWSSGVVRRSQTPGEWLLALHDPFSKKTFAHELSHLYAVTYFKSSVENLPHWLNEGLAAMMEKEVAEPVPADYKGPAVDYPIPFGDFFARKGGGEAGGDAIFYAQAHSVVRFLKKMGSPMKFEKLCRTLRDGGDMDRVMFSAYGFSSLEQFEQAWRKWKSQPAKRKTR